VTKSIKDTMAKAVRVGDRLGEHREDLESEDTPLAFEFSAVIPEGSRDEGQRFVVILKLETDVAPDGPDAPVDFVTKISVLGGLHTLDVPMVDAIIFALVGARTLASRLEALLKKTEWSWDDWDEYVYEAYPRR
jgi:hypothetical protein